MNLSLFFRHLAAGLFVLTSFTACDQDPPLPEPQVEAPLVQLSHDGSNVDAPQFPSGVYEGSVRFTPADLAGLDGKSLVEVIFYTLDLPRSATLRIYQGTENNGPKELLLSDAIGSELTSESWHRLTLDTPIALDTQQDLWIGFRFDNPADARVLGCDPGPAATHGDYLFDSSDGQWRKLSIRTNNGININWNLRGVVQ